jgi:hypothetical protein
MNRYQPSIPRTLVGLAAVAFSALTIAATVALPAKTGSPNADTGIVASACGPAAITPDFRMRLEVVGVREPDVAAVESTGPRAERYPQG